MFVSVLCVCVSFFSVVCIVQRYTICRVPEKLPHAAARVKSSPRSTRLHATNNNLPALVGRVFFFILFYGVL